MKSSEKARRLGRMALAGTVLLGAVSLSGCQVDVGGQTLPSPWYMTDDVQYFPPGPEFKLSREAAALKERSAQVQARHLTPAQVQVQAPVPEQVPAAPPAPAPGMVPPAPAAVAPAGPAGAP